MRFLTKLERKIGWITIHNLPLFLVATQGMVYLWLMINPSQVRFLVLDPAAVVYGGEYWRLITFLFVVPLQNALFAFFFLYLLYIYGNALEQAMGSFAFTLFYVTGALGTIAGAMLFGNTGGAFYLNTSIFLAFAALHPNFQLLLFFILPVKVKWLAWIAWAGLAYSALVSPPWTKISILVSIANYFLFFSSTHARQIADIIRRARHRQRFKDWNRQ